MLLCFHATFAYYIFDKKGRQLTPPPFCTLHSWIDRLAQLGMKHKINTRAAIPTWIIYVVLKYDWLFLHF